MEVEFKKDLKHNYMVITQEELTTETYCIRMLEQQTLSGVLRLQQRFMDNRSLYYYDITGKQSMKNLFTKAYLSYEQLRNLLQELYGILNLSYEYLLPEDDFILNPEFIYMDVATYAPYLCFLSGYQQDSKTQISGLLEYLMNKVDYQDKEAVLLVYRLYAISKEEDYTLANMYEVLHKDMRMEVASRLNTATEKEQIQDKIPSEHISGQMHRQRMETSSLHSSLSNIPVVLEKVEEQEEVSCYPVMTYIYTALAALAGVLILILGFTTGLLYNSYGDHIEYSKLIGLSLVLLCAESYLMRRLWCKDNKVTKIITKSEYIDPRQDYGLDARFAEDKSQDIIQKKPQIDPTQLTKREYGLWKELTEAKEYLPEAPQAMPFTSGSETLEAERAFPGKSLSEKPLSGKPLLEKPISGKSLSERSLSEKSSLEPVLLSEDYNPTCLLCDTVKESKEISCIIFKSQDEEQYPSIPIKEFPFFIGKLRKNVDYCLENNVVSRYHAKLTKEEDRYYITDLNSTNGTFVNDQILNSYEKKELLQGDRIALANLCYELRWS
jgi:hypothetical protein